MSESMNDVTSLQSADRDSLVEQWKRAFKCEPPARSNTGLLRRVLAWHAQCEANGLKPLASISSVQGSAASASSIAPASSTVPISAPTPTPTLSPGTRLLREWRGNTHEVRVVAHGFEYAGQSYKSLSRIARTITGTPWSGPAFFGLKN
ncbi:DUF2924 domain-containing protein [Hydrogenophaga sp. BPS33]|nr:DUF2924 domain-containing protein [Hydrogenophaga sp. BPS33]